MKTLKCPCCGEPMELEAAHFMYQIITTGWACAHCGKQCELTARRSQSEYYYIPAEEITKFVEEK